MLVSFNFFKNYITAFAANFPHPLQCLMYWTRSGTRPKSGTSTGYENALWTNGISWISASSTKSLQNGK